MAMHGSKEKNEKMNALLRHFSGTKVSIESKPWRSLPIPKLFL